MAKSISHSDRIVTLQLDGRIPSKKNSKQIFRNSRTNKPFITASKDFKAWLQGAIYQISLQKSDLSEVDFPIQKCEYIHTTIFYGDQRGKDNTNVAESIHDLLVDTGVIADDKWQITGETKQIPIFREKQPGALIVIKIPERRED